MIDFLFALPFLLRSCEFLSYPPFPVLFSRVLLFLFLLLYFLIVGWSYEIIICMMGTCGGTENPNVYLITGFSLYIQQ
jgi:hypothetical protein